MASPVVRRPTALEQQAADALGPEPWDGATLATDAAG